MEFTTEEKLARMNGVGASEVGYILGLDDGFWDSEKKRTVKTTWQDVLDEKTGQSPHFAGNQYTDWGNRMEPVIVGWYTDTYGGAAEKSPSIWSPKTPFAFCTPDRVIVRESEKHGLECKNKAYSQKPKWKNGPPPMVEAQARWSMLVTEWDRWDIAVLINGNDPHAYVLHRETEWEEMALREVTKFWKKVTAANKELWG